MSHFTSPASASAGGRDELAGEGETGVAECRGEREMRKCSPCSQRPRRKVEERDE
jgi:hypothetical protein